MLRTNRQTDKQTDGLENPTHADYDIVGVGNSLNKMFFTFKWSSIYRPALTIESLSWTSSIAHSSFFLQYSVQKSIINHPLSVTNVYICDAYYYRPDWLLVWDFVPEAKFFRRMQV